MTKFMFGVVAILAIALVGQHCHFKNQMEDMDQTVRGVMVDVESMDPSAQAQVNIEGEVLTYLERYAPDSVYVTREYVPPEGDIELIVRRDTVAMEEISELYYEILRLRKSGDVSDSTLDSLEARLDSLAENVYTTEIHVDHSGFCLKPAIGINVNEEANIGVDAGARIFYMDRFGIGIQGSVYNAHDLFTEDSSSEFALGGYGDVRIPKFENVSGKLFAGYNFNDSDFTVGVGINFYLN